MARKKSEDSGLDLKAKIVFTIMDVISLIILPFYFAQKRIKAWTERKKSH